MPRSLPQKSCQKTEKKHPQLCYRAPAPIRYVEPFSIAAFYQPNVEVIPPYKLNVFQERNVNSSLFRTLMLRGDIPCQRSFTRKNQNEAGTYLMWKIPPQDLDYAYYMPVFFDGLSEPRFPYNALACYGIHDMLNAAGDKISPVIPQIIIPIKNAFNTKNRGVIAATLRIIQHLCMSGPCVGQLLVPYYRQFLPALRIFASRNYDCRDRIDFDRTGRLGDVIDQTLMMLERCGGKKAYMHIKRAIPTYESCINN